MKRVLKVFGFAMLAVLGLVVVGIVATHAPDVPADALKVRWASPPSQFIDVSGLAVHVRDEGWREDPVPLVLLHGTSASLHTWQGWVDALAGQRRVIRADLPGFALTGPNADNLYPIDTYYAPFVIALLDRLGIERCVLGGNSLGGQIAWVTAVAYPNRVERLILVDAGGYPVVSQSTPIGFRIARTPVLNRVMEFTLPRSLVEQSVRNVYGHPERVTPELVDLYFDMARRAGNRRALVARLTQGYRSDEAQIAKIKQPTLILWGGRDRLIPSEHAARFAHDIAGSQLVIFDDLGHVPQEEDPARTSAAVQRFLDVRPISGADPGAGTDTHK